MLWTSLAGSTNSCGMWFSYDYREVVMIICFSLCSRLAQDLTHPLIVSLQQECTRTSCPEMKAGEWMYLCVAHGNDGAMEVIEVVPILIYQLFNLISAMLCD